MAKILICDDEAELRAVIKKYAIFEGHQVVEAGDGMEAIEICRKEIVDLIIMDVMMPELDGFSAVREIKKIYDVPVIMLSARGEEYDKIHGFDVGIDDYVVKPFSSKEVMLRINAILRRVQKSNQLENQIDCDIFKIEGLEVDMKGYRVTIEGNIVNMAPKEYELLFFLIKNKNIVISREKLLNEVWGYDYFGDDRTLDTHMKLLRRSLGSYAKFIITLRGVGYKFEV